MVCIFSCTGAFILLRFSPLLAHHEKLAGHFLPCVLSCAHYVRYESKYGLFVFLLQGPSRKIGQRGGPVGGVSQEGLQKKGLKVLKTRASLTNFFFFFLSLQTALCSAVRSTFPATKRDMNFLTKWQIFPEFPSVRLVSPSAECRHYISEPYINVPLIVTS